MRRSKGKIIAKILEICLTESSKTVIVEGSDLNFRTVVPYLEALIANGQIVVIEGKVPRFKTTDRGKELLAAIKETHEFF